MASVEGGMETLIVVTTNSEKMGAFSRFSVKKAQLSSIAAK